MKENQEGALRIEPVEQYTPPNYPTRADTRSNPKLLTKLPSRWQKNATIIACLGLMGSVLLSGCAEPQTPQGGGQDVYSENGTGYSVYNGYNAYNGGGYGEYTHSGNAEAALDGRTDFDLTIRVHYGGSGAGPFYVAHLTEQEALSIVRAQLEAAGLDLSATPPDYGIGGGVDDWLNIGLDFYDAEKGVAAALISAEDANRRFSATGREFARLVANEFSIQTDMPVGVFYNPGETISGDGRWVEDGDDWTFIEGRWVEDGDDWVFVEHELDEEERKAAAGTILEERLAVQVQVFVALLRERGIV